MNYVIYIRFNAFNIDIPNIFWFNYNINYKIAVYEPFYILPKSYTHIANISELSNNYHLYNTISIIIFKPLDKLIQIFINILLHYPHILLPLYVFIFYNISVLIINNAFNIIQKAILKCVIIINNIVYSLSLFLAKTKKFINKYKKKQIEDYLLIKNKNEKLLNYTLPANTNLLAYPVRQFRPAGEVFFDPNQRIGNLFPELSGGVMLSPHTIMINSQTFNISPFDNAQQGFNPRGFLYQNHWIEVLPRADNRYQIGPIYTPVEINQLRSYNDLFQELPIINTRLEGLRIRYEELDRITLDHNIHLGTDPFTDNLHISVPEDAIGPGEQHMDTLRVVDNAITRNREQILPMIQNIERITDNLSIDINIIYFQSGRRYDYDILRDTLDKYYNLISKIDRLYRSDM